MIEGKRPVDGLAISYTPVLSKRSSFRLGPIMAGMSVEISAGAKVVLETAGLRDYQDFLQPPQAEVISQVRDRVVYFVPSSREGMPAFYLKAFTNKGANHPLLQLLSFETPHSLAEAEVRRLRWLETHDFPAPRVLAWGARMNGPWEIDSFLVTEELADLQAMDEWLEDASRSLPSQTLRTSKRKLLTCCARTLSQLHKEGFDHPFPYLRHFFVPRGFVLAGPGEANSPKIAIIDVHTARIGRTVSWSNRQRALAELLVSSLRSPLSQTDRLYFLQEYCGGKADRELLSGVIQRLQTKLRRHPNRYRWVREVVTNMPFPSSFRSCGEV